MMAIITRVSLVEPVSREKDYPESRISSYRFEVWNGAGWSTIVETRDSSAVRIHRFTRISASRVRLSIQGNRDDFHVADLGIYNEPDRGGNNANRLNDIR
jgi:alpha-L-fucosidase